VLVAFPAISLSRPAGSGLYDVDDRLFSPVYSDRFDGKTANEIYAQWNGIYKSSRPDPVTEDGWLMTDWNPETGLGYAFKNPYLNARYEFDVRANGNHPSDRDAHSAIVMRTVNGGNLYGSLIPGRKDNGSGVVLHIFNEAGPGCMTLLIADAGLEVLSEARRFDIPYPSGVDFSVRTRMTVYDLDDRLLFFAAGHPLAAVYFSDLNGNAYLSGEVYSGDGTRLGAYSSTRVLRNSCFAVTQRNSDIYLDNLKISMIPFEISSVSEPTVSALCGTPYEDVVNKLPLRAGVVSADGFRMDFDVEWEGDSSGYSKDKTGEQKIFGTLSSTAYGGGQGRRIAASVSVLPSPEVSDTDRTVLYQIQPSPGLLNMAYIIRTAGGKLIVIDGGGQHKDRDFVDWGLFEKLQEISGEKHPVVDAWFLTHLHPDHVSEFVRIGLTRSDEITVRNVYCNLPSQQWHEKIEPTGFGKRYSDLYPKFVRAFDRLMGDGAHAAYKGVQVGEMVAVDNVTFDILQIPNGTELSVNDSSLVFRMTAEGQTVLFVGDLAVVGGNRLAETYGSHLQSDIVQMAHHGQDGVNRNVYDFIQPSVCFWPTPDWLWAGKLPRYKTQTVRGWMSEIGVETHFVAGLLGTSEFEF
jgi:hypothetical protein